MSEAECFVVDRTLLQVEQEFEGDNSSGSLPDKSDAVFTGEGGLETGMMNSVAVSCGHQPYTKQKGRSSCSTKFQKLQKKKNQD